ncbi:hypothetical protein [Methylophilus sp.]|uniref:hypothetical protein n=1 Tax=Methylophilus sp. TaxID=29541 RepID=UPI000D4C36CF|nr:hypothetical protein [Methylophilus sp.]PPD10732.1 MAG: hypothetical protein CTY26_12335 [Methylophilus sp.]
MPPDSKASTSPLLWVALLFTLVLVYWQWLQEGSTVPSEDMLAKPASPSRSPAAEAVLNPQLGGSEEPDVTNASDTSSEVATYFTRALPVKKARNVLFAAHEWLPPPPKPQPPPPPQAPPLPYAYVGSMQDVGEGDIVILLQQKKLLLPKIGSQVSPQWRLDREDAQAVYFTYLPLNKVVMLSKTKTVTASQRQAPANAENNYSEEMFNQ